MICLRNRNSPEEIRKETNIKIAMRISIKRNKSEIKIRNNPSPTFVAIGAKASRNGE